MATITTRAGKGSPLTNTEVDNNFTNINTELGQKESASNKGVANGYASLDGSGKVPSTQLPSYVDDVVEGANLAALPATGETGKIYVVLDTNKTYRWSGSAYVEISASPGSTDAVTEGSTNLYFTNARARGALSGNAPISYNSTSGAISHAVSGVTAGSYGSSTSVPVITVDATGHVTGVSTSSISGSLTFTGDVTGSGSTGSSTALTLANSGVVAGTYTKVTVDAKGRVTTGASLASGDLPTYTGTITSSQVTTALGFTPYNSSNPSGYITSSSLSSYLPLSGGTLTGTLYFTDTTNGLSKSGGRLTVRSESTDNVANFAGYGLYLPQTGQTAGLYVESPIEARGGLRIGNGAGSGTITVGADTSETASRLVQRDSSGGIFGTYIRARKNQTAGDYTTAAIWTESYGNTATGVAFHISGNVGKFLEMRTNGILYWNGDTVIHSGNYSSWALPLSGGTVSGATNFSSGITVNNTSADGRGINLYSGSPTSPTYGLFFAQTGNFGTYGAVSADWATYFTMNSTANRGWIFREVESLGNVAAISNQGNMTLRSHFEQGNNIARPNVSWSANSTSTGMVIFYLPGTTSNYGMIHMVFDIYEYNGNAVSTVIVGGHNWSTSWYNTGCNVIGQCGKSVRLGVKDGRFCVVFGTSGSSWDYGTIVLRKIHNGSFYDNIMNMVGDWSATQTTTESFTSITGDLRGFKTPTSFEVGTIGYAYQSFRSPIFYDYDNTGYYFDGASTSRLNEVQSDRTYGFTDIRSPIFYDYNNTAYYVDPASSSRLSTIYCGDVYNDLGGWFRNYGATGIYNQSYGNHFYSDSANYWNVGIGGQTSGGIRFRDTHAGTVRGYVYVDNGNNIGFLNSGGNWRARVVADDYFLVDGSSARAQIFYDSNDTGYYFDGASTTRANQIHANYIGVNQGINTSWPLIVNGNAYLNGGGYGQAEGSWRAPIFYDSADTTYYVNPNDYSVLYGLSTYYIKNNYDVGTDHPFGVYFATGLSTAYAIYREPGAWNWPYPDLRIAFHTGIKLGANSSYQGVRFYTDYDMSSQVMSVNNGSDPLGGGNVYVNSALQAGGSLRAPIFYDSNDTGYYLDGASTSRLNYVVPNRIKCVNNVNNEPRWDFSAYVVEAQHWYGNNSSMTMYLGESNYINIRNTADVHGDVRSPVYYDRNNTAYYLDPTSTTAIRTVGSWRADAADWDGEFNGKIQYHASHWYFQYASLAIFRNSGGSNVLQIDQSGNLTAQGNVTAYSDRRLKENVSTLSGASDYLARIDAKTFRWKSDGRNDIGFIAQDVEEAGLPEFVIMADTYNPATGETAEPIKSLDYGRMVSVLWQAVKEQKSQIAAMSAEINSLKERLQ